MITRVQLDCQSREGIAKAGAAGINVRIIAAISEELFDHQPESYRNSVLPPEAIYDLMVISTGTRRMWPLATSARSPMNTR